MSDFRNNNKAGSNDEFKLSGDDLESIEGVVERVVYHNPENGYSVIRFSPVDESEDINVVGSFMNISEGLIFRIYGKWINHPKFGKQFTVERYDASMPRSLLGIRRYMASFIKGIGPKTAEKIVDHFGEETIDIIENEPQRLKKVPGIGKSKAELVIASWDSHKKIRAVMMFLQSHNVGPGTAMKIYNTYGDGSISVLRENPYLLATEISGIGFKIADKIAMNLGLEKDSPVRLEAGIMYTLDMAANEGHVYLPSEVLVAEAAKSLDCGEEKVETALVKILKKDDRLIEEDGRIYSPSLHYSEVSVAETLAIMASEKGQGFDLKYTDKDVDRIQKSLGFELSRQQMSVLDVLAKEKLVILTGGPGTGKTISIKAVISLFTQNGHTVELAAPTGRAAKRMSEATGFSARTIHRLLEFNPRPPGGFARNRSNPIEADLVVIDEISMIDIVLMHYLCRALRAGTRLLMVGDVDQLPSVGAGNVLRDLIASECISTVRLQAIYRQDAESSIVGNAYLINQGQLPSMATGRGGNFFFTQKESPEEALDSIVRLCTTKIPAQFNVNTMQDVQVISPMYKGVLGVDNLNTVLRDALNPGRDLICGSRQFRHGDRVMQIKNNYDKEVYNGDVGFVKFVNLAENTVLIDFQDQQVKYSFEEVDQLVQAYAITVHKSQGSEYPVVVMPMSTLHYTMLQRNLLYTAITRASKAVIIVGTKKAIAIAVKNNKIEERYTSLGNRLSKKMGERDLYRGRGN